MSLATLATLLRPIRKVLVAWRTSETIFVISIALVLANAFSRAARSLCLCLRLRLCIRRQRSQKRRQQATTTTADNNNNSCNSCRRNRVHKSHLCGARAQSLAMSLGARAGAERARASAKAVAASEASVRFLGGPLRPPTSRQLDRVLLLSQGSNFPVGTRCEFCAASKISLTLFCRIAAPTIGFGARTTCELQLS